MDPGIPHGRAGDRRLRPGTAQRVPRGARGHRRRDPGGSGRGHHRGGGGPGTGRSQPRRHPDRQRLHQPAQVRHAVRPGERMVHRAPRVRRAQPADPRAALVLPRPRQGGPAAPAGPALTGDRRPGAVRAAAEGTPRRDERQPRRTPPSAREGQRLRQALRRLRRVRGHLSAGAPHSSVGLARRRRPLRILLRPSHPGLDPLRAAGAPAVDGGAGPAEDGARRRGRPD